MARETTRRALLALSAIGLLAGCSRREEEVTFEVRPDAMDAFVAAFGAFAGRYGYSGFNPSDLFRVRLKGFRTIMALSQIEPGYFIAQIVERTDLWLISVPDPDLGEIGDAFRSMLATVDGVSIVRL